MKIEGLLPLTDEQRAALDEFRREMEERVIPEIVETVRRRQELARESSHWTIGA